jgi:hypothetical protein
MIALKKAELRAFKQRKLNQKNARQSSPHKANKTWKNTKK